MLLQTKIPIPVEHENQIDYSSKIVLFGSCFVEHIGNKLAYLKFDTFQNPFGILFHPKAIERLFEKAILEQTYGEADVFLHNEQWHCFDAHSSLNAVSKNDMIQKLNASLKLTKVKILQASHIVITLGTSWVYEEVKTQHIVANCHKIPQTNFNKKILPIDAIKQALMRILHLVNTVNTEVKLIFTVSPVRHIKDGFIENTKSKSHLIAAIHEVVLDNKNTKYFPSFEIMMDELRDYRFYKDDMLHPNTLAVKYIWGKFKSTWLNPSVNHLINDVDAIQKGLKHRPFNENSEAHQKFISALKKKQNRLESQLGITF